MIYLLKKVIFQFVMWQFTRVYGVLILSNAAQSALIHYDLHQQYKIHQLWFDGSSHSSIKVRIFLPCLITGYISIIIPMVISLNLVEIDDMNLH